MYTYMVVVVVADPLLGQWQTNVAGNNNADFGYLSTNNDNSFTIITSSTYLYYLLPLLDPILCTRLKKRYFVLSIMRCLNELLRNHSSLLAGLNSAVNTSYRQQAVSGFLLFV